MSTAAIAEPTAPEPVPKATTTNPWGTSSSTSPAWGGKSAGSPWGNTSVPAPCSLEDVMSEELAKELQNEEDCTHTQKNTVCAVEADAACAFPADAATMDSDLLLAQMLQHEFNQEHDELLRREEAKLNGTSKVTLSFTNYHQVHPALQEDDSDEELDEDYFEKKYSTEKPPNFNKNGIAGKGKNIVTKHDAKFAGQQNANRLMELPGIDTGDDRKIKMRLPNHVYNKLKLHSQNEHKRAQRLHEKKEHSTAEAVVDPRTRLILYKLVNGGILDRMDGIIASGKESGVYHAAGGRLDEVLLPAECAVKVFRTTLSEFKNRCQYVKGDIRFFKDNFKRQNPRKIMKIWASKEEFNLRRMQKCGLPCPKVVTLKKHVLVMSFIGENGTPAPQLREAKLGPADVQLAYDQCINNVRRLYQNCGLVHADLSEYNMLWHKDTLYFIDVAQAVERAHPLAHEFLLRDCQNVSQWFSRAGVVGGMNEYELFNYVTGLELKGQGEAFLSQIEDYEKNEEALRMDEGKDYPFEFFFAKAQKEREGEQTSEEGTDRVPSTGSTSGQLDGEDGSAACTAGTGNLKLDDLAYSDEDSDEEEEDEDWEILKVDPDVQGKLAVLSLDEQTASHKDSSGRPGNSA